MDVVSTVLALCLLMTVAYRGYSVILLAPVAALLAVVLQGGPGLVMPMFSGVFMEKLVGFLKTYFPVFLLGALFGKLIEVAGFARAITEQVVRVLGSRHAMLAVVLVGALLTYGGVSLFVAAFAVYPFASELFRAAGIPRRLIPGTIGLGVFTFTMDALPGSPQIQNIIPTTFFHTTTWAAPRLGLLGAVFVLALGLTYLERRRRQAADAGEGYGDDDTAAAPTTEGTTPPAWLAFLPLVVVGVSNLALTRWLGRTLPPRFDFAAVGIAKVPPLDMSPLTAIWAVEGALVLGLGCLLATAWPRLKNELGPASRVAVAGALLAAFNTASEYGFGGVIAALPGFHRISSSLGEAITNPLLSTAVTTTALAGITGSASGGMSIALAAMGAQYLTQATAQGIPPEVLHRVAAMASGGMDTLPHNGAVITLLAVTGLTHRQAYRDIFAMTVIKTSAVFFVIAVYYVTGLV